MKYNAFLLRKITGYFSNLPGPRAKLAIAGVNIDAMCNVVAPMFFGIGVSVLSYNGDIVVAISTNDAAVARPADLLRHVEDAFEAICQMAEDC